jgi:hypothetical protein
MTNNWKKQFDSTQVREQQHGQIHHSIRLQKTIRWHPQKMCQRQLKYQKAVVKRCSRRWKWTKFQLNLTVSSQINKTKQPRRNSSQGEHSRKWYILKFWFFETRTGKSLRLLNWYKCQHHMDDDNDALPFQRAIWLVHLRDTAQYNRPT